MKKFIPILSATILIAACNNPKLNNDSAIIPVQQGTPAYNSDTAGLAQFQQWKAQHELANVKEYNQATPIAPVTKEIHYVPVYKAPKTAPVTAPNSATSNSPVPVTSDDGTMSSETSNTAKATEKKGWSKAAKGAVIGGVSGAAAGAVINKKNRAIGAVVGGVLGAGGGYAIGHGMDKNDGRF